MGKEKPMNFENLLAERTGKMGANVIREILKDERDRFE
jgi:hypothetical protein